MDTNLGFCQGSYLAPPVLLFMNKHPMVEKYDLSSLRNIILGAAPVSSELILDTRAKLRARGAKDLEITQVHDFACSFVLRLDLTEVILSLIGIWTNRNYVRDSQSFQEHFAGSLPTSTSSESASTHILPPELSVKKVGSIGVLLANQQARLVDEEEKDVAPGDLARGELWIRGPNIMK